MGFTSSAENSIRILVGILLGPQDLEHFMLSKIDRTSTLVQGFKNMLLPLGFPKYDLFWMVEF